MTNMLLAALLSSLAYAVATETHCDATSGEANVLLLQKNLNVQPVPVEPAQHETVNKKQEVHVVSDVQQPSGASVSTKPTQSGLVQHGSSKGVRAFSDWDPELYERACLQTWMNETGTSLAQVCSDKPDNNIKDDKGNYIQFTRREDKLMYNVFEHALEDCTMGETYVRDIIASFAERTSCFQNETTLFDEPSMYAPVKVLIDGDAVVTDELDKKICPGDEKTPTQSDLDRQLGLMRSLVEQWDSTESGPKKKDLCREMLAAHTLDKYEFVGALHTSRPAACNPNSIYFDESLCQAAEEYLLTFLQRDLFANVGEGERGRAGDGENERSERCKEEQFQGKQWFEMVSTNPGQTVEIPKCTIDIEEEVFPEPILKVGVLHEDMANNIVADAFRQCGAPFVAGISATMPQYLISAAAGPTKKGKKFEEALSLKEMMVLMSMLELGGFHALTSLSLAVNFYYKDLVVTPPFDSGAFVASEDHDFIRCHDTKTSCCTNTTKADGFYNHQVYLEMIESWESLMQIEFVSTSTETVVTDAKTTETRSGASTFAWPMLVGLGLVSLVFL